MRPILKSPRRTDPTSPYPGTQSNPNGIASFQPRVATLRRFCVATLGQQHKTPSTLKVVASLNYFTPWAAGIPVALEFGERIVQDPLFGGARPWASDHVLLLKFTKPAKDLLSPLGAQLRKLRKDIGFIHEQNLTPRPTSGEPCQGS